MAAMQAASTFTGWLWFFAVNGISLLRIVASPQAALHRQTGIDAELGAQRDGARRR